MGLHNDRFTRQEYLISAVDELVLLMGYDETFDEWVEKTREAFVCIGPRGGPMQTWQGIGTHYAVNDFLERVCGVRWYFIGELGECGAEAFDTGGAPNRRTPQALDTASNG